MRGVADGSGFAPDDIAALQVRYEILYYQFGHNALSEDVDGCTAFAVLPEASTNGHLLVGQNWDWIPQVQGAVLHATDPERDWKRWPFTEAGHHRRQDRPEQRGHRPSNQRHDQHR